MSAKEDLIILNNILARGGDISEIDLHSEFAKAKSFQNRFKAQGEIDDYMNSQRTMQSNPIIPSAMQSEGGIPSQPSPSIPQESLPPETTVL